MGHSFLLAERAQARAFDELLREAKKVKADYYIGHNLGALAVCVNAAKCNNAIASFDFEDYHRRELPVAASHNLKRICWLENRYIPQLAYFSMSSEMITKAVEQDHPNFLGSIRTLSNCFPLAQLPPYYEKTASDETLQLFWFSQTIGKFRGLEILVEVMMLLKDSDIHLTLAGSFDTDVKDYLLSDAAEISNNIHFAGIIQPEHLPTYSSKFDVGMALKLKEPLN